MRRVVAVKCCPGQSFGPTSRREHARTDRQWSTRERRRTQRYAVAVDHPRAIADDRHQVRLRRRPLRRLHRPRGRRRRSLLPDAAQRSRRQEDHDDRRPERTQRPSAAEGVGRRAGASVRLLPVRPDHAGGLAAVGESDPHSRRNRRTYERQSLPLHDLSAHSEGHRTRRQRSTRIERSAGRWEESMTKHQNIPGALDLSRRSFLVSAGTAGLVCGFGALPGATPASAAAPYDPTIWYGIGPDGIVTVNVGKADMGQHVASTMAQIVAEELGAAWSHMRVNLVGNDPKYNDPVLGAIITGGSWSTMMNFDAMSRAGAAGRMALVEAAAGMLGVPAGQCVAFDSRVSDPKSGKAVSYADIVKSGKVKKAYTADELKAIVLKTADQYTLIGKELPQLDIPFKVNGTAKYGIDTFLPGMVYGRIVTPPVRYGAKVTASRRWCWTTRRERRRDGSWPSPRAIPRRSRPRTP